MMKDKEAEDLSKQHAWLACLALEKAFANDMGQRQHGAIDWTSIAEAAYHAGIATGAYRIRSR